MNWDRARGTAAARRLKPSRATAVLKPNLIRSIEFGTAVARRLKRALFVNASIRWTKTEKEAILLCFGQESKIERSETELFEN